MTSLLPGPCSRYSPSISIQRSRDLLSQARAAQVLLGYRASYNGFINRRTRATDSQGLPTSSSSDPVQEGNDRSRTPPIPNEPILLAEEASTSLSSGYTPSPPHKQDMSQPINLSSLLNLLGRGQGHGASRGQGNTQGHGPS